MVNCGKTRDQEYLFDHVMPKGSSVLQVGARGGGASEMTARLKKHGYTKLDVLEIFEPNVAWCKTHLNVKNIIQGDIRKFEEYEGLSSFYDTIIWWHGPEHITQEEFFNLLPRIMARCSTLIVGAPWGLWNQDELNGNPNEKHLNHLYPEDLESLGFLCYTFQTGTEDGPDKHNVFMGIKTC